LAVGVVAQQTTLERRAGQDVAGRDVIGMPIAPIGERDGARPRAADQRCRAPHLTRGAVDSTVGPLEVDAPRGAQHDARLFGPGASVAGVPVHTSAAAWEIPEPAPLPPAGWGGQGAADANLVIAGGGSEDNQIDGASISRVVNGSILSWGRQNPRPSVPGRRL